MKRRKKFFLFYLIQFGVVDREWDWELYFLHMLVINLIRALWWRCLFTSFSFSHAILFFRMVMVRGVFFFFAWFVLRVRQMTWNGMKIRNKRLVQWLWIQFLCFVYTHSSQYTKFAEWSLKCDSSFIFFLFSFQFFFALDGHKESRIANREMEAWIVFVIKWLRCTCFIACSHRIWPSFDCTNTKDTRQSEILWLAHIHQKQ